MVHLQFDFHDAEKILETIMGWKIESKDNTLQLLCEVGHERVAAKFMDHYFHFSNYEFFFECVVNEKQYFLKYALRNQYFDTDYMHRE